MWNNVAMWQCNMWRGWCKAIEQRRRELWWSGGVVPLFSPIQAPTLHHNLEERCVVYAIQLAPRPVVDFSPVCCCTAAIVVGGGARTRTSARWLATDKHAPTTRHYTLHWSAVWTGRYVQTALYSAAVSLVSLVHSHKPTNAHLSFPLRLVAEVELREPTL